MRLRLPVEAAFSITPFMSQGAMNWPFLTFTILPVRAASRTRSVCRQRNAGICRTSATCGRLLHLATSCTSVRIGTPEPVAHAGQDLQAALDPRPAVRAEARPVGLVVAGLEDEGDAELAGDVLEPRRHLPRVARALDDARPGDQEERAASAQARPPEADCPAT